MTAKTVSGLPYPEGTDRVVDGDNAIRALAEAIPVYNGIPTTDASATVDPTTGVISFSAKNAIKIPTFIVAGFNHYRIDIDLDSCSGTAEFLLKMVDNLAAVYAGANHVRTLLDNNTSATTTQGTGTATEVIIANVGGAGAYVGVDLSVRSGVVNTAAWIHSKSYNPSGAYQRQASGYVPPQSGKSWLGIQLSFTSSVTASGRITIAGRK